MVIDCDQNMSGNGLHVYGAGISVLYTYCENKIKQIQDAANGIATLTMGTVKCRFTPLQTKFTL